jgi:very-short-patch-repair endonuclease
MGGRCGNASRAIRNLADRRAGVVARRHLNELGVTDRMIERRVQQGSLIAEHPGVYRVGPRTIEARYWAAVLACGPGAVLSGRAAAWLWGLVKGPPPPPEVSAPTRRRVKGLATRHRRLHPGEKTSRRGIPVTTVPLTLFDLSPSLAQEDLARACHEAGVKNRTTPRQVAEALARRPNTKGAAKLRAVLEGEPVSLSKLETRFLALLREAGLPPPVTNKPAGAKRVDCRWPEHRLTVELDSYRFHNSRHSWEQDRRREREARARGDDFARYTWGDVFETPRVVVREVAGLIYPRSPG